jgi:multisubunit Na+/H+ antiporter MnhC subunit
MRSLRDILGLVLTIAAAIVIGFGVPLLWVWIGSQLQGVSGVTSLNFSVAVAILLGIIATYVAVLYLAAWVTARFNPQLREQRQRGSARQPWMRGMSDTRALRPPQQRMPGLERVFVTTTIIVSVAFTVWLLFIAGSPLPNP